MTKPAGPSILVVDDEFSIVETLTDILGWEGFTVTSAHNGKVALERIEANRPDLLLLDYMMPVMDGLQLLKAVRAHPDERLRSIPVIMMTAAYLPSPSTDAAWDAFLRKPFEIDALLEAVGRFVKK